VLNSLWNAQHCNCFGPPGSSALKQLVTRGHLRVADVLDFDPVRARAIAVVAIVDRLRDGALKVVRAGNL
jgi:hypothetical protein